MIISVPKERMKHEYRVGIVPAGVHELVRDGHRVIVEKGAGLGSNITDAQYRDVGAQIARDRRHAYARADLIVKVKEPLPLEWGCLKKNQAVFCFFHFAAHARLFREMLKRHITCLAYETVEDFEGRLPLLTPMSEVAGRMAVQEGAKCLERPMEGRGILLGGVPGVAPARVAVLGGGVVGSHAARTAAGLGARVTVLDVNLDRLRYLEDVMPDNVSTEMSNPLSVASAIAEADLVICAALRHGARAPVLITRKMLKNMKPGSAIVDVAVDQGGSVQTTRPTTHGNPTYVVDGVVHYSVTNMPGAVAGTSTYALTNATFPYIRQIANEGVEGAAGSSRPISMGVNLARGKVVYPALAETFGMKAVSVEDVFQVRG